METKMYTGGTGSNETATPTVTSEAVEHTGTVSPETGGQVRRYLGVGWRFTRHLQEMVVAMVAGMAALGVAIGVLGANLAVMSGTHSGT